MTAVRHTRFLLALALMILLAGCLPDDSSTPGANRPRKPVRPRNEITVPQPAAADVQAARATATDDTAFLSGAFQQLSEATRAGNFTHARTVLASLNARTPDASPLKRVLADWAQFIETEQSAAAMLDDANARRGREVDIVELQNRSSRIKVLFSDPRLKELSRVLNDPAALPDLDAFIARERPARLLWGNYEDAKNDMSRAISLVRLLKDAPDSEMVADARDRLGDIMTGAARSVTDLNDSGRTRDAFNEARRWAGIIGDVEPWGPGMARLAESLEAAAKAGDQSNPLNPDTGNRALDEARRQVQSLLEQRYRLLEDDGDMRYYISQLQQRSRGLGVRVPPMPMIRHYRAVCDQLFEAGRYADVDRLLERHAEDIRPHSRTEHIHANLLRQHYRQRFYAGVRDGSIDPRAGDWCYWSLQQGYFGGRDGKPMTELRLPRGMTACTFPDDTWRDFELHFDVVVTRCTLIEFFAKCDPGGRYGLHVSIQLRNGNNPVREAAEADSLAVVATVYLTNGQQTIEHEDTVPFRSGKLGVDLEANGERALIKVNGRTVLEERLKGNTYFPAKAGIFGFSLTGEDSRVDIDKLRVRQRGEPVAVPQPDELTSLLAMHAPDDEERELEAGFLKARDTLLAEYEKLRAAYDGQGRADQAKQLQRDIACLAVARLHTATDDSVTFLADALVEQGQLMDAAAVLEGCGLGSSSAPRVRVAKALEPIAMDAFQGMRVVPMKGGTVDDIAINRDEVRFRCGGVVSPQEPQFCDFEMSGKLKISHGASAAMLLRKVSAATTLPAFVYTRFLVRAVPTSRGMRDVIRDVEVGRGAGGNTRIPLVEEQDGSRTIPFRVVVVGARLTLWIDKDKAAEILTTSGLSRWSSIGFYAEPDENGRTDVRFTDLRFTVLRQRPPQRPE
ncbi:MAG: hypothetical protein AB7K09_11580 [Planctomycetota bacterium]